MFRKLLIVLFILILGITILYPFLANQLEGMTTDPNNPTPNPNPNPYPNPDPIPNPNPTQGPPPTNNINYPNQINYSTYPYDDSLPKGIHKSQIIPGQEDLYILKTQVVPPVCPACNPVVIYKNKKCEPCPACARCPESSFECKKVPNYNALNNEYLPKPVLNSFSSFGM